MVACWSISEKKYPQKSQGTAGLEPATVVAKLPVLVK
jgi:hypothetical protein